jgi:hypothetical protein
MKTAVIGEDAEAAPDKPHAEIIPSIVDRIKRSLVGLKMPRAIEILEQWRKQTSPADADLISKNMNV